MSTLTIFLCAAAFFTAQTIASSQNLVIGQIDQAIEKINASAMRVFLRAAELGSQDADKLHELFQTIASSENQEKDAVIRQIDQAIEKINASATQVFRQATKINLLEGSTLHQDILQTYKDEASQYLRSVNSIVDHYANSNSGRNLSEDKKKECMSYYDAYKTEFVDIVQGSMDSSPWNASDYAHLGLGDLLHMAFENKIALENLKLRVNVGNTTEWNNIKENVKNISTRFVAAADKAQKFYEGLVDGTSAVKVLKFQTKWYENVSKGMDVVRKVYDCIDPKSWMLAHAVRAYNALFP